VTGPSYAERDGPPKTRVEIVDDHLLFAQALGDMVGSLAAFEVVGIAQSGAEAVAIARETQPDLILLDFHLPGANAIELMPDIRSCSPGSRIVVLTSDTSEATRIACMTAGADAYLTKDQALDDIEDALAMPTAAPVGTPVPEPPLESVAEAPPVAAPAVPTEPEIVHVTDADVEPAATPHEEPEAAVDEREAAPEPQTAQAEPEAAVEEPKAAQEEPEAARAEPEAATMPSAAPEEVQARIPDRPEPVTAPERPERAGQVIAVYSPKGGVGTTTVAINLAVALAARPDTGVGVLDLDLLFGDVAVMMDLQPPRTVADLAWERRLDQQAIDEMFAVHRSGVHVLAAPSGFATTDVIDPDRVIAAIDELRTHFAYLVIDLATALDRLTVDVLRLADRVVLVTTPELAALRQLARVLGRRPSLDLDLRSMIVVNRSPGAAGMPIRDVERALGHSIAVTIRSERRRGYAGGEHRPLASRGTSIARSYAGLAEQIVSASPVPRA